MSKKIRKGTKVYKELTEGLPSRIRLKLDWDGACDLSADRRNCIIHRALMHKDEITRPTVGVDKITFIWRGDARIEVRPEADALAAILENDKASQGLSQWPTGQQTLYLSLREITVRDLRPAREKARAERTPEKLAVQAQKRREWSRQNRELERQRVRRHRERVRKANKTKQERGRFILKNVVAR